MKFFISFVLLTAVAADHFVQNGGLNGGSSNGYSAPSNGGFGNDNLYSAPSQNGGFNGGSNGGYSAPPANGQRNGISNPSLSYGAPEVDELEELAANIPGGGTPGEDYPILSQVPETKFSCEEQEFQGYYADTDKEAQCQVFHICQNLGGRSQQDSFLCPNGSIFNQQYFVCDWWFNVDCSQSEQFYGLNELIGKEEDGYETSSTQNGNGYENGVAANGNGGGYGSGNGSPTKSNGNGGYGSGNGSPAKSNGNGGYSSSNGSQGKSNGKGGYGSNNGSQAKSNGNGGYGSSNGSQAKSNGNGGYKSNNSIKNRSNGNGGYGSSNGSPIKSNGNGGYGSGNGNQIKSNGNGGYGSGNGNSAKSNGNGGYSV